MSTRKRTRLARFGHGVMQWRAHILTVLLTAAVIVIAPQQTGVLIYKACLIPFGACVGYWLYKFFDKDASCEAGHPASRWQMYVMIGVGMIAMAYGA